MLKSSQTADNHIGLKEDEYPQGFWAAAPEVQMLVCVSVCDCHTCYNCTGLHGLQNLLVYKSQPPGLRDLF